MMSTDEFGGSHFAPCHKYSPICQTKMSEMGRDNAKTTAKNRKLSSEKMDSFLFRTVFVLVFGLLGLLKNPLNRAHRDNNDNSR